MRVVFFGTPAWAVPALEALAASSVHVPTLVVTQPPKRRGRGETPCPSAVAAAAERLGLTVSAPASVKTAAFAASIALEKPDVFVVVAYGKIFPGSLLGLPRHASINVHFSLLPAYRGAAPVQWAIARGERETGVTTMAMVAELDAGPIYLQQKLPIGAGEHAPVLGARLSALGAELLLATLAGIAAGTLRAEAQDPSRATYARLLRGSDGWIDWSLTAEEIACRVRGFDPWPGQAALGPKGKIKILAARAADPVRAAGALAGSEAGPGGEAARDEGRVERRETHQSVGIGPAPGAVLGEGGQGSARIACGGGTLLEALFVQSEGRRAMSGAEALRGRHVRVGDRLVMPGTA